MLLTRVAKIKSVTVTMSSWACQSGAWNSNDCVSAPGATYPTQITLYLYRASSTDSGTGVTTPGSLFAAVTKTFHIPYRPSASVHCTGTQAGEWFKNGQGCQNGIARNVTFTLSGLKTKLPKDVVWGVTYSSDNSGPDPIGSVNSPQDSLNVALAPKVRVGQDRTPDSVFWDTRFLGFTCGAAPADGNGGPFDVGVFNQDGPCNGTTNSWEGYVPAAQFNAY